MINEETTDRDLVREVLEGTRRPATPGLTRRVRERVGEERRRRATSDGGWQLGLAGGTLVLAMVAGLLVESGDLQWPAASTVTPAPSTGTLAHSVPAVPGVQPTLLLPADPGPPPSPMRRVDWTGRGAGALMPPAVAAGLVVSPDGALVAVLADAGSDTGIIDAGGRLVARLPAFGTWSGDGAHLACALVPGAATEAIVTTDLRDPARPQSTTTPAGGLPGGGWTLLGCTAGTDLLVATRVGVDGSAAEVDVVRLSTGRLLSAVAYGDGPVPVAPVLSPDARDLAENDPARPVASIRDLLTGEVVGHVTGLVTGFSGDGRLVLVDAELGDPASGSHTAIVDWRWNRTVWAAAGHAEPLAARPGGRDLAVSLSTAGGPPRTLLVSGDGSALDLDPARPTPGSSAA
jgi:hypothetical protein